MIATIPPSAIGSSCIMIASLPRSSLPIKYTPDHIHYSRLAVHRIFWSPDHSILLHNPDTSEILSYWCAHGHKEAQSRIVSLGPQQVQLINGCRYLRFFGSNISSLHSSQIAISGETKISPFVFSLSMISNSVKSSASSTGFNIHFQNCCTLSAAYSQYLR